MESREQIDNIRRRLRRVEGQIKGIERMIEEDSCCMDILVQISAVRAAISKVGVLLVENHVKGCLQKAATEENRDEILDELLVVMSNFIR